MTDLTAVADAIRANDRFLLVTHENPDGDALGSILAMKLALDALGKESVMYVGGEMALPPDYDFLPLNGLRRDLPEDAASRVVIALDSATAPRTRLPPEVLEAAPLVIDVDHHHDNTRYGAINLIVAEAIYVALDTDTGRFQYANTTRKAHALAGELMDAGVEPQEVFRRIFESV